MEGGEGSNEGPGSNGSLLLVFFTHWSGVIQSMVRSGQELCSPGG